MEVAQDSEEKNWVALLHRNMIFYFNKVNLEKKLHEKQESKIYEIFFIKCIRTENIIRKIQKYEITFLLIAKYEYYYEFISYHIR